MKSCCAAKPVGSFTCSKVWIAANRRNEDRICITNAHKVSQGSKTNDFGIARRDRLLSQHRDPAWLFRLRRVRVSFHDAIGLSHREPGNRAIAVGGTKPVLNS